jgi:hypothetical protein
MQKVAWGWVLPPLATSAVTLFHPLIDPWHGGIGGLSALVEANTRWLLVHGGLLILFPLTGLALAQAVAGAARKSALVARAALAVFAVTYAAFDTFAGLATGSIACVGSALGQAEEQTALKLLLGLWSGPVIPALFLAGTAAWMVGAGAVAIALRAEGAPLAPVALIAVAGPLLFLDHPPPFGPITFALSATGLGLLAWKPRVVA